MSLPTLLQPIKRILFFGDSITASGSDEGGYIWFVERYLKSIAPQRNWQLINAGISGDTSLRLRDRLASDVLQQQPEMVVMYVGVNDVWHRFYDFRENRPVPAGDFPAGVPLQNYREHLQAILNQGQAAGISFTLLSPTPIRERHTGAENQQLQAYIAAVRELAIASGSVFVDLYEPFMTAIAAYQNVAGAQTHLLTGDGVHPNRAGSQLIAYQLLRGWGITAATLEAQALDCVGLCN